ncbi:hypothetical protein AgCh_015366 [Apium graveolens]
MQRNVVSEAFHEGTKLSIHFNIMLQICAKGKVEAGEGHDHMHRDIRTYLGIKGLEFNLESDKAYVIRLDQELRKAKINDLRAAIFQTGEDTAKLKDVKRRMINELRYAEKCLLKNYLRTTPDIREIRK